MNQEINIIGIYPGNCEFESDYLPLISFKTKAQKDAAEKYIIEKVKTFFKKIIKIDLDVEKTQIKYPKIITDKDFASTKISWFYNNLFFDLECRSNNKLDFNPKWGITFDEKCAPIMISYLSSNYPRYSNSSPKYKVFRCDDFTFYRYGTIDINGEPIFYYIYFTIQEIIEEIKRNSQH
jgi:hypothetical protein